MSEIAKETCTSDYWKLKGNELYKAKNYQAAISAYTKSIDLDANNASLLTNRAAASLMLLLYKEAVQDCDTALSIDSTNSKAYFRKATGLKGLGKLDDAIVTLNKGLEHDPLSPTALADKQSLLDAKTKIIQMKNLVVAKQYSMALLQVDNLIKEIGSNFRELNLLKVEILLELNRPEDAYNLTNSMMRTAQNGDIELLRLRAQCFYSLGDLENSLKHLQQALRSDPDNSHVKLYYRKIRDIDEKKSAGDLSFKNGEYQEAVDAWAACLDLTKGNKPFSAKLHLNRATALYKIATVSSVVSASTAGQSQLDKAAKDCNMAIYYNSKYIKAYLRRAECYIAMGGPTNIEKGISDYETAFELETDDAILKDIKLKVKKARVALKRSKRKDLYAILGVSQNATESEIKTAYRKAALKYHPDKQASKNDEDKAAAEVMFKSIGEAYEVLSTPDKKKLYDEGVEVEDIDSASEHGGGGCGGGGHRHHHGGGGMDPNIIFQMFMQQQAQQGRR